jgi:hypothetical protein
MNDFVTSLIRTYVPMVVGSVVAWLSVRGFDIDPAGVIGLTAFLSGFISAAYYLVVRILERQFPSAGVLLGSAKKPEYTDPINNGR